MAVDIYVGLSNLLNKDNSFFTWLKRLLHYTYIHFRSYPSTRVDRHDTSLSPPVKTEDFRIFQQQQQHCGALFKLLSRQLFLALCEAFTKSPQTDGQRFQSKSSVARLMLDMLVFQLLKTLSFPLFPFLICFVQYNRLPFISSSPLSRSFYDSCPVNTKRYIYNVISRKGCPFAYHGTV